MVDLACYQNSNHVRCIRLFREKTDAAVALMERNNGERYICRLYAHPVVGYEAIRGAKIEELPQVYRCEAFHDSWLVEEEYVDGISLSELMEVYHPDEQQACAIAVQLCRALSVLHEKGIIHRDIKPENVLITSAGRVVLIDLDATSYLNPEKSRDTMLLGTVGYAAPEQFGFGRSDVRADIFSLGVLLNTMLTGKHPAQELAAGNLRPIIERCIAVNVDQRYLNAQCLMEALLPLAGEAEVCPECGFTTPGGGCLCCGRASEQAKPVKPKRSALLLAAAAIVGLALLLAPQNKGETGIAQNGNEAETADGQPMQEIQTAFSRPSYHIIMDRNRNFVLPKDLPKMPVPFRYDLDGDGTAEPYYFGTLQSVGEKPTYSMWDSVGRPYDDADRVYRTAAPAVFEKTADGSYLAVEAFADILQNPEITVYCIERFFGDNGTMPVVAAAPALYGIWQGAEEIEYSIGCIGGWMIEASAVIDGEPYTAFTLTKLRTDWRGIELPEGYVPPEN